MRGLQNHAMQIEECRQKLTSSFVLCSSHWKQGKDCTRRREQR